MKTAIKEAYTFANGILLFLPSLLPRFTENTALPEKFLVKSIVVSVGSGSLQ